MSDISDFSDAESEGMPLIYHKSKPTPADGEVFAVGADVQLYEPIAQYEGRHRYDPTAEWTEKEEKILVRKGNIAKIPFLSSD